MNHESQPIMIYAPEPRSLELIFSDEKLVDLKQPTDWS